MIPVYALFVQVNLIDSMAGAILFLGASGLPYAIFLTKGFMDTVPMEIEESAWTEGAGVYRTLWSVVMPLMRSGLAVATIFTFVGMWGNFFVPFMLLLSPENLPAAVTLYTFSSQYGQVAYGQLAAFSIFYSLPVRSEEHTSELQSRGHLVCRLLLEKKKEFLIQTSYWILE